MQTELTQSPAEANSAIIFETVNYVLGLYVSPASAINQQNANDAGPAILAAHAIADESSSNDEIFIRALSIWLDRWHNGPFSVGSFNGLAALTAGVQIASKVYTRLLPLLKQLRSSLSDQTTIGFWRSPAVAWEDYDLISGPAGVILTLTADNNCPAQIVLPAALHLAALCDQNDLGKMRISSYLGDDQRSWNFGRINTGLAHGVAGVVTAMRSAAELGGEIRYQLLDSLWRACNWLVMEAYIDNRGLLTWHPADREGKANNRASNRQAWCYGTPGIAWTLWEASRVLGDDTLRSFAEEAMRSYCSIFCQSQFIDNGPLDSALGICHGAAGMLAIADVFEKHAGMSEAAVLGNYLEEFLINRMKEITQLAHENMTLLTGASGILSVLLTRIGGGREWLFQLGLR